MITIQSENHRLRNAKTELYGGQLVRPFECPERVDHIIDRVKTVDLGPIEAPQEFGREPLLRVHDADFLYFLETALKEWKEAGFEGEAIATCWPARRMVQKIPNHIDGKLGYYALATETSISEGTWEAARASANVALSAAKKLQDGAPAAFALCRPPGHHAAIDMYGGYCFLNNAAIAAQWFRDQGAGQVAILDVDFHHGNGTQDIFYSRNDVFFASLHGDPKEAFPHFLGYEDETGAGKGEGFNANYPMAPGTPFSLWGEALEDALKRIDVFGPEVLVVSLGVDTFEQDPISFFKLTSQDFMRYGEMIAGLKRPTLFVMEGGYAVAEIGVNAVNVLQGFEAS